MKKFEIGTYVMATIDITYSNENDTITKTEHHGKVLYHGRNKGGVYTRVGFPDGTTTEMHRASLRDLKLDDQEEKVTILSKAEFSKL